MAGRNPLHRVSVPINLNPYQGLKHTAKYDPARCEFQLI